MKDIKQTDELTRLLAYIQDKIQPQYNTHDITLPLHYILGVLEHEDNIAHSMLEKLMISDMINLGKSGVRKALKKVSKSDLSTNNISLNDCIEACKKELALKQAKNMDSAYLLFSICNQVPNIKTFFNSLSVTIGQLRNSINKESKTEEPTKHVKKKKDKVKPTETHIDQPILKAIRELEEEQTNRQESFTNEFCDNLIAMAANFKVPIAYECDTVYERMFTVLSKQSKNNVVVTGKHGVGKTCICRNLANLIISKNTPKNFTNKIMFEVDIPKLFAGATIKGVFEHRCQTLIDRFCAMGNTIVFLDNIDKLYDNAAENYDVSTFVENILKEKQIMVVITCNETTYNKRFGKGSPVEHFVETIQIDEPTLKQAQNIVSHKTDALGNFHMFHISNEIQELAVKLAKRYITNTSLPDSALDLLDETCAMVNTTKEESKEVVEAKKQIEVLRKKLADLKYNDNNHEEQINNRRKYEADILTLCGDIQRIEKEEIIQKINEKPEITDIDLKKCISQKTGISLENISFSEKERLRGLDKTINSVVIGQKEAVDNVCMAVKRQRVGMSNSDKPVVLFFAGSSGCGKTYLAKTLAREVFGSENKLIRFDMCEFADGTSVNKLIGSSAGYIGYENGGLLTERIKKQRQCVLLLDEMEKANEDVHNLFLSLFDEGRLTDNKGITVDFKDVIIIMTSNIGAKESSDFGTGVGFVRDETKNKQSIIDRAIKNKFRPEFINRIDKIVYFNDLTDDNLKSIINIEINAIRKKVQDMDYDLGEDILNGELLETVFEHTKKERKYGARPIKRELLNLLENPITEYIINNDIEKGHVFNMKELHQ